MELQINRYLFGKTRSTQLGKQLDTAVHDPVGHQKLLKAVYLDQMTFYVWYRWREMLPEFWFTPHEVEESRICVGVGNASSAEPAKLRPDEQDRATGQKIEEKTRTSAARKGAQRRHEPLNRLKQEFFDNWDQGKFKSRADAAGRFYNALPPEKKKLLVKSNAVRTLREALGKHLSPKGKQ